MKKYDTVLFDLDGTISNTYSGIKHCLQETFDKFGLEMPSDVTQFIGPPLQVTFTKLLGETQQMWDALDNFRTCYTNHGMLDCHLYEGIDTIAEELRAKGVKVGVATSKYHKYAVLVLEKLGILQHTDFVYGCTEERLTKTDVINAAIDEQNLNKETTLMVGDTFYDMEGAKNCGIDVVGVLYGFGKKEELKKYPHKAIVEDMEDLSNWLFKHV